jgi:hypothetical protein
MDDFPTMLPLQAVHGFVDRLIEIFFIGLGPQIQVMCKKYLQALLPELYEQFPTLRDIDLQDEEDRKEITRWTVFYELLI